MYDLNEARYHVLAGSFCIYGYYYALDMMSVYCYFPGNLQGANFASAVSNVYGKKCPKNGERIVMHDVGNLLCSEERNEAEDGVELAADPSHTS